MCNEQYADFVVWTLDDLYIEQLTPDKNAFEEIIAKSKQFFCFAVLPEQITLSVQT